MSSDRREATFYTISDSAFFVGTVALLNSLRLSGNAGRLVVLDRGFTREQADLLASHTTLVRLDASDVGSPAWLKPYPSQLPDTAGTIVIVDSDAIVTGSLSAVLDDANAGRICAFSASSPDRWYAEWEQVFDLVAAPRHQPYVASGFVAFSVERWPELLPRWWTLCWPKWSLPYVRGARRDPLQFLDQDAFNAVLMTEFPPAALDVLPREANPFGFLLQQVEVDDLRSLRFTCRGTPTLVLHNSGGRKPWERGTTTAFRKWRPAYVRALRRVLCGPDLAVRLPTEDLPWWLREGPTGAAAERSISLAASIRYRITDARRSARTALKARESNAPTIDVTERRA